MMAGIQDYWEFCDDFIGAGAFGTSASEYDPWVVADTSASGTPTYERVDHGASAGVYAPGVAKLTLASTNEVENVCLSFGDKLCFDINSLRCFEARVMVPQTKDAATQIAFGLTGDRNDAIDSIAQALLFRLAAASASNAVVVESDDGTNNNDDVSAGVSMTANTWHRFKIDFSQGLSDVRFFMGDGNNNVSRVGASTTFDLSNYAGGLQPFFQLQKTADTNVDSLEIDYVKIWGVR